MVNKIISGGQTGADQGGLEAASILGLETGGWFPNGCMTQDGPRYDLLREFNMQEHSSPKYAPRTFANARDSDGTIRIADNFHSPGEICTLKAIRQYKKPVFDVPRKYGYYSIEGFRAWLKKHNIRTLNVAGNAEKTAPGIFLFTTKYLVKALG